MSSATSALTASSLAASARSKMARASSSPTLWASASSKPRVVMAGVPIAVASLGTSLTAEQARLIKRFTGNVFVLYDGDNAGLDANELAFISGEMSANPDAKLTLAFGHHPLVPTGNSSDTYLFYGKDEFVSLMNGYGASLYGYGHTHASSEKFFTQNMTDGVFYFNVSSIGKDSPNQFTVTAIDCNGISSVTQTKGAWPVVLITAPLDRRLGGMVNPYAYSVTNSASNPIRALVFDPTSVTQVQFRVNGLRMLFRARIADAEPRKTFVYLLARFVKSYHFLTCFFTYPDELSEFAVFADYIGVPYLPSQFVESCQPP